MYQRLRAQKTKLSPGNPQQPNYRIRPEIGEGGMSVMDIQPLPDQAIPAFSPSCPLVT